MSSTVVDHKCPRCRANLVFNPKGQNWHCNYCDSDFTLSELEENKAKYDEKKVEEEKVSDVGEYNVYKCSNCGAEIVTDLNTSATFCVYCKNTSIIKERLVGAFEPKYIIPFQNTKEDAVSAFRKVGVRHPLMPSSFSSVKNISEIRGIYIPFWLFSSECVGDYKAVGEKKVSWREGDYRCVKTDCFDIQRRIDMNFKYVPNDGSKQFDDAIMNSIEPFDYGKMIDFSPSYLSGFLAEKYDVSEGEAKEIVDKRIKETIKNKVESSVIGYASLRNEHLNISKSKDEVVYALLPVWFLNIKYKDKFYTFAMNGETGKLIGNMPVSINKVIVCFIVTTLISFVLCYVVFYLFVRGNV